MRSKERKVSSTAVNAQHVCAGRGLTAVRLGLKERRTSLKPHRMGLHLKAGRYLELIRHDSVEAIAQ